jgi:signal peptidase II
LKQIRNYSILFGVAAFIIGLDQWTKQLVRTNLPQGGTWLPDGWNWLAPYARIINWYNNGAAFGTFQGYSWVFTILAFVVAGLIIYYYHQVPDEDWWLKLTMGLQLGGALGNVVDRIFFNGNVTDFISVGTFPVFNVADASISVGVAVLLIGMWLKDERERDKQVQQESAEAEALQNQESENKMGEISSE